MKRKEKKSMLLKLHQEVKLISDDYFSRGFCSLATTDMFNLNESEFLLTTIYKYHKHTLEHKIGPYWFEPGDWKIRLSFLEEVMKVELNPYYKLAYKLGLYKFKY